MLNFHDRSCVMVYIVPDRYIYILTQRWRESQPLISIQEPICVVMSRHVSSCHVVCWSTVGEATSTFYLRTSSIHLLKNKSYISQVSADVKCSSHLVCLQFNDMSRSHNNVSNSLRNCLRGDVIHSIGGIKTQVRPPAGRQRTSEFCQQ